MLCSVQMGYLTGPGNNAVISFLYSALLTRGLAAVRADMDSPESSLVAAHGYCSQARRCHLCECTEHVILLQK